MRFFTKASISNNLSFTPEGFLVCANVPIARTGDQIYYAGEVPITPDQNGAITITRSPEAVFDPAAIASFEGKPVTMTHPEGEVTPDTWKEVSIGHTQNIRKGEGIESDALYGDLLIMEKDAIKAVLEHEIREVSCGYDAEYEKTGPGRGKQLNIRGNHVALVERGRCGALCAIHDHKGEKTMKMKGLLQKFPKLQKFVDGLTVVEHRELESALTEDGTLTTDQRVERLEKAVNGLVKFLKDAAFEGEETEEEESEEEKEKKKKAAADKRAKDAEEEKKEEEEATKAKDCAYMQKDAAPAMQEILYRSSILAPDLSRPTMDSVKTMDRKAFNDTCCLLKRRSLDAATRTEDGKKAVEAFTKGADVFTADCAMVDTAFIGASEIMKHKNTSDGVKRTVKDFGGALTVAEINKQNADFWAKKGGA